MRTLRYSISLLAMLLAVVVNTSVVNTTVSAQEYILFNGGISSEERASAPTTSTKLVFFVRAGNFLSDVSVVIKNAAGQEMVNTVTKWPWLILDLPAGRYQVTATIDSGETQSLMIEFDGTSKDVGFMFTSVE